MQSLEEKLIDAGRIKTKGIFVVTVGVDIDELVHQGIVSSESDYISQCDIFEKEVDDGLRQSDIGEFHYPDIPFRDGECLSITFIHKWDLRNGRPNYNIPPFWEILQFHFIDDYYPNSVDQIRQWFKNPDDE